jgi:hypothetical protein
VDDLQGGTVKSLLDDDRGVNEGSEFVRDSSHLLRLVRFNDIRLTQGCRKYGRLTLALEYPRVVMIVGRKPLSELRVKFIQL